MTPEERLDRDAETIARLLRETERLQRENAELRERIKNTETANIRLTFDNAALRQSIELCSGSCRLPV